MMTIAKSGAKTVKKSMKSMTEIICIKVGSGLMPVKYADDRVNIALKEIWDSLPTDKEIIVDVYVRRNPENHKRYFAFIQTAFDMQKAYSNIEIFRKALQIKAGHYDLIVTHEGQAMYVPRSIKWTDLDETKFQKLFKECVDAFLDMYEESHNVRMTDKQFFEILDFK